MAEADRLFDEANSFLANIVAAATDAAITLPTLQYVTVGEAVHDCEQVVVTIAELGTGLPENPMNWANCALPWTAQFEVDIVRCEPKSNQTGLVPKDKLHDHAKVRSGDASLLMEASRRRADLRYGDVSGQVSFPAPSGGMTITRLLVNIAVF